MTFSDSSGMMFQNCTMLTVKGNLVGFWSSAVFSRSSYFVVTSCILKAAEATAFRMDSVTFTNSSFLTISSTTTIAIASSAFVMFNPVVFSSSSFWAMTSCIVNGGGGKAFTMSNSVSFTDFSYLVMTSCNMTSTGAAFSITFSTELTASSFFTFTHCIFSSSLVAFGFADSTVSIHNSSLKLSNCSFAGFGCFGFASTRVQLSGGSVWEIRNSTLQVSGSSTPFLLPAAVLFSKNLLNLSGSPSSLELRDMSTWIMSNCTFKASLAAFGVLFSNADVTVVNGSSWRFVDSNGVASGTGAFFSFSAGSKLTIKQSSEVKILRSAFMAASSPGLSFTTNSMLMIQQLSIFVMENGTLQGSPSAVLVSKDSKIMLEEKSAWVISGMILASSSMGGSVAPVVFQLKGSISVVGASMFSLRASALHFSPFAFGQGQSCVDISLLTLSGWGVAQMTDNNCSGAPDGSLGGFLSIGSGASGGYAGLFERCNIVNGAVWRPVLTSSSFGDFLGTISSLPCGRCDSTVDCFWPLTEAAMFTRMACGGDPEAARQCPCIPSCGGGEAELMCLPGVGTAGCSLNGPDSRPRLPTTHTVSASVTRTGTITTTATDRKRPLNGVLRALRVVTVAFASTAVLLSGPSGAGMIQRMQAQQLLNSCGSGEEGGGGGDGSLDFSSSPTQMQLGPNDSGSGDGNGPDIAFVRGAVVGNLLIWLLCLVVASAITTIVKFRRRDDDSSSWEAIAAEIELPGRLYWPYCMLSVPTLTSSTMLLFPWGATRRMLRSGDVALGVLGIVVCSALAACVALVLTGQRFRATATSSSSCGARSAVSDTTKLDQTIFMRCKKWIQFDLSSRWEWVDRRRARGFVKRWGALFDGYGKGRQWFGVVELGAGALVAALAGLVPMGTDGRAPVCQDLQVVSAVAAVAFLAAVVLLRPYGSPMDGRLAKGNAAVTAVSSMLGVFAIDTVILTAVQAILNGVSALVVVIVLLADGSRVAIALHKFFGYSDGGLMKAAGRRFGDRRRQERLPPELILQQMVGTCPITVGEQRRALEDLVWIICGRMEFAAKVTK